MRHHRALAELKQNKTKIYSTKSLPDRITWQTTSHSRSSRFHSFCRNTVDSHTTLVSGGLLDKKEWDKIWNDLIGKDSAWLNCQSSFQFHRMLIQFTIFLWSRVILQTTSPSCWGRLHDYFTVDNHTKFVFQGPFSNGMKYGSQGFLKHTILPSKFDPPPAQTLIYYRSSISSGQMR